MEQNADQIAAEHAEPPDGGEDRLSALPDEVLVLILECLDTTAEAARTSVLARRWRGLWPLMSKFHFHLRPDVDRIRELLDVRDAPELRHVSVTTRGAAAGSATAVLAAAARRLAGGGLAYSDMAPDLGRGDRVQLPCFEKATAIKLFGLGGLILPSVGVFTQLVDLSLSLVHFHGPCEISSVVSSPRCPCLQKLSICSVLELRDLSIQSESLLQVELGYLSLLHLTIVTPILHKLSVKGIFVDDDDDPSQPVANISAPQMVSLVWKDRYDPQYFHLGDLGQLQELQAGSIWVYGFDFRREENDPCLRLLQQFQVLYSLHLKLIYENYMHHYCKYLLGDITLPQIMFLQLDLRNEGHAFGASLFHLLGLCNGLKRLLLVLSTDNSSSFEEEFSCSSDCICDQPKSWKTDELMLDYLEDVHIIGLQGAEHEVAFVQQLLSWATILKSLKITLDSEVIEGKIEEFREALAGFSRPEICIQFEKSDK